MSDPKLDQILSRINELSEKVDLLQAVVLELTKSQKVSVGKQQSGRGADCVTSGCEDQCSACQE